MWDDRFCMRNIGDDLAQDHNLHLKTTLMSGNCEKIILKLTKAMSLCQSGYGIGFQFEYEAPPVLGLNWVKETSLGIEFRVNILIK